MSLASTDDLSLDGKVAIVTGAGAGLGRVEALALAEAGARVVLNDLPGAADSVAEEIRSAGGSALVVPGDVGERATADALTAAALGLGSLDIVVNNAGVLRDKMLFSLSDEDWDLVIRVHLRGHFLLTRNAAAHWREASKAAEAPVYGRVITTASEAFLFGPPGQANYAAAKAGITALTMSAARALNRFGVTANAICPRARTAMTEGVFGADQSGKAVDPLSPEHVAPLVAYLASPAAGGINGEVFVVYGGMVALLAPPTVAQRFDTESGVFNTTELHQQIGGYLETREESGGFSADSVMRLQPKEQM